MASRKRARHRQTPEAPTEQLLSLTYPAGALRPVCALFDPLENVQFWIKDRDGRYCWVNRGFLLNYSLERREQVIGKTDFDLSPPHLADQYRLDDARVLRGEAIQGRVELVGRFDHTAAWSVTQKLPMKDARGRICGSVGLTRVLDVGATNVDGGADAAIGAVLAQIRTHCAAAWSNANMARAAHLSVRAFERRFRALFRVSPQEYIRTLRVRLASYALVYSQRTLAAIATEHGFANQSHFTREFRRETGVTPGAYRKKYHPERDG